MLGQLIRTDAADKSEQWYGIALPRGFRDRTNAELIC
jgi:hypothetical protein